MVNTKIFIIICKYSQYQGVLFSFALTGSFSCKMTEKAVYPCHIALNVFLEIEIKDGSHSYIMQMNLISVTRNLVHV